MLDGSFPNGRGKHLSRWLSILGDEIDVIPGVYQLWSEAQDAVNLGDERLIRRYTNLIYLLHNTVLSPKTRLGLDVRFAYGGIANVIHLNSIIGNRVALGQGITLGGNPGSVKVLDNGEKFYAPRIADHAFIGGGARVLGAIEVGRFAVIGVNAVVLQDVPPLTVCVGSPARQIRRITVDNCLKYKGLWTHFRDMSKEEFISLIQQEEKNSHV